MNELESNRQVIRDLVDVVWRGGDVDALPRFWTEDCVNHAALSPGDGGLAALRDYHAGFADALAALSDIEIHVLQQVAEGDMVATQLVLRESHTGEFAGVAATGRPIELSSMRFDQLRDGRIAEHWSVADMAGLLEQMRA